MTQTKPTVTASRTGKWKPYSAYKDSGVEWLGEVPAHWEMMRLKYVARDGFVNGLFKKKDQFGSGVKIVNVVDLYRENFLIDFENLDRVKVEQQEYETFKVLSGDIFFVRSSLKLEGVGASASIIEVPEPTVFECHVVKIQSSPYLMIPKYLIYNLNSFLVRRRLVALAETTTMTTIAQPKLASLEVTIPPISEQRAISAFLDRETTKISTLIAKKERLVELLQEKRAALISHAVTKGLDPTVPMKDTGVEWLGEIPAHWGMGKIGAECTVKARLGWKGLKASEYVDEGYIFLATPNIKGREIDFENVNHITAERYFESPEIMLQIGDVLVAKDGSTLGITSVIRYLPAPSTVNSSIAVIRPQESLNSVFLYWFLSSNYIQEFIQRMKDGMGVPHLFQADLRKFVVLIPSLPEQRAIAAFLDRETAKIDALVSRIQEGIEKLKEYSSALISAAVTGKIDVREEVLLPGDRDL